MERTKTGDLYLLELTLNATQEDKDVFDVGSDHLVRIMYADEEETTISSLVLQHPHLENSDQMCVGYAEVGPGEWEVVQTEPLTIHPSFICNDCGDHGLVIKGAWIPATTDRNPQEMPDWLYQALSHYCYTAEEVAHVYRRPLVNYDCMSLEHFVRSKQWEIVGNILVEIREEHKKRSGFDWLSHALGAKQ